MFDSIHVRNFRAILDSGELTLSQLNVLVGPNNSGKSSILAILLLLKQTLLDKDANNVLVTSGPLVDLGSYLDIVREDPESKPMHIAFRLSASQLPPSPFFQTDDENLWPSTMNQYGFDFLYDSKQNEVFVQSFSIRDLKTEREISGTRKAGGWVLQGLPEDISGNVEVTFQHFVPTLSPSGKKAEDKLGSRLAQIQIASLMNSYWLNRIFQNVSYVGPIRERIPRYGILGTMPFSEITPSGQNLMRVLSAGAKKGSGRSTIKRLNDWLDKRFKMLRDVRMKNIDRGGTVKALTAEDRQGRARINLAATGAGISQIVPVVVQTVLTRDLGTLIVEQPEVHLHPAAQTVLADLFLENLGNDKQYIIETHSEHFVLRLRRRIAEGKVPAKAIRIMFVEKKEGQTCIRQLDLSSAGDFVEWPEGFFDEGYQEALALAQAGQKRSRVAP